MKRHPAAARILVPALAFAALAAMPAPGDAQEEIDELRPLARDADVEIGNIAGSITVTTWDRAEIEITGFLGEGTERLDIDGDEKRLRIRVIVPKRARDIDDTDLEIRMPPGCRLEIGAVSADVRVEGITGELTVESVSGDIDLDVLPRELEIGTVSGEIDLIGGAPEMIVGSVSGDIVIDRIPDGLVVDLEAETVSGDLVIGGATFTACRLNTVSGEIEFLGRLDDDGEYTFNSHSGDVDLRLVGEINARFDLSTYSGEIDSDFGPQRSRRRSRYGGTSELRFEVGAGEAEVTVETFSGDIVVEER
jgi:hypothetical protein